MKRLVIFLFILFIPLSLAGSAEYTIVENKALAHLSFSSNEYSNIEFPLEKTILEFNPDLDIEYITSSFTQKSGDDYFFITSNKFHIGSNVEVILPSGAILNSKYFVFPKNYIMSTNGQNIIISWENLSEKDILIPYTFPSKFNIWPFLLSLFVILLLSYIIINNHKRKRNDHTKNLFGDEKKIIKYLTIKKECWTKELVRDLNISKVKLSRRLRSLEEKGLIARTPHGNENRINLVK